MSVFVGRRRIEWGDCDAAGIVFYPNYFRWMDSVFHEFTQSLGFDQRRLSAEFGLLGTPLLDVGCTFRRPARYYDDLDISLRLVRLGQTSFALNYIFRVNDTIVAEGNEVRAVVQQIDGKISSKPIPQEIRDVMAPYLEQP